MRSESRCVALSPTPSTLARSENERHCARFPRSRVGLVLLVVLIFDQLVLAQAPPLTAEQEKATADIHEYFRRTTARLADATLADVKTLDDWQQQRPVLREQLLEMLGLAPLPERTDLHATVTGTVEHDEFIVEKLHF